MPGAYDRPRTRFRMSSMHALLGALNGRWHAWAMPAFAFIVIAHWLEHLLQAAQIFLLGWPRPTALGALGMLWPWLVSSEWMHYLYALVMLLGLIALRPGTFGLARTWWSIALAIQVWHHFEHALLLGQALAMYPLFGATVPTSVAQIVLPRVELHLLYNVVVTVPMVVAMYAHMYPTRREARLATCRCARLSPSRAVLA
jgi:hypothetical protein